MVSILNYYAVPGNMSSLAKVQSNNIGNFFFQWGTGRATQKCTVHGGRTKPDLKHILYLPGLLNKRVLFCLFV